MKILSRKFQFSNDFLDFFRTKWILFCKFMFYIQNFFKVQLTKCHLLYAMSQTKRNWVLMGLGIKWAAQLSNKIFCLVIYIKGCCDNSTLVQFSKMIRSVQTILVLSLLNVEAIFGAAQSDHFFPPAPIRMSPSGRLVLETNSPFSQ